MEELHSAFNILCSSEYPQINKYSVAISISVRTNFEDYVLLIDVDLGVHVEFMVLECSVVVSSFLFNYN